MTQSMTSDDPIRPYALISHESAVEAIWSLAARNWRETLPDEDIWLVPKPEYCVCTQGDFKRLAADVDLKALGIRRTPADLLVPNKSCYSRGKRATFHVWQDFFPPHSFVRVHERVLVSTPYFAALQLAKARRSSKATIVEAKQAADEHARICAELGIDEPEFTSIDLIRWGNISRFVRATQVLCDFSGTYRYVPHADDAADDVIYDTRPILSLESFDEYLSQMPKSSGIERGRTVATMALPNAASPMETALALVLTLPVSMGGFGLPRPRLNWEVPIEPTDRGLCSQSTIFADMAWPERRVIVEYYGWDNHFAAGPKKVAEDLARANSLTALGWTVLQVTFEQIKSPAGMTLLARQVQVALDAATPKPTELELVWRSRLLAQLLPSKS